MSDWYGNRYNRNETMESAQRAADAAGAHQRVWIDLGDGKADVVELDPDPTRSAAIRGDVPDNSLASWDEHVSGPDEPLVITPGPEFQEAAREAYGDDGGFVIETPDLGRADSPVLKVVGAGKLPTRTFNNDAGLDLYALTDVEIPPNAFRDVPVGIRVEFPAGWWGRIVGRSSTVRNRKLLVTEGIIDEGYRGDLFVGTWNLNEWSNGVREGDRIAQLILHQTPPQTLRIERVEELALSARGELGFGSSGC